MKEKMSNMERRGNGLYYLLKSKLFNFNMDKYYYMSESKKLLLNNIKIIKFIINYNNVYN